MNRPVRTWLIIESVLAVPAAAIGAVMAMFSPMMFDAPGSTENQPLWVLFWSVVSFPVVTIAAIVVAWIVIALRRDRVALWISLVPVVPVITGAIAFVLMS